MFDHYPAIVLIDPDLRQGFKPFKFFDFWAESIQFLPMVAGVEGYWYHFMFKIFCKLKA